MRHRIEGSVLCTKREAKLRFRLGILQSWQWCCAYCGAPARTLDHVRAKRRGGPTVAANLVAACSGCNQAKGSADWLAWFRQQAFWCGRREAAIALWTGTARSSDVSEEAGGVGVVRYG